MWCFRNLSPAVSVLHVSLHRCHRSLGDFSFQQSPKFGRFWALLKALRVGCIWWPQWDPLSRSQKSQTSYLSTGSLRHDFISLLLWVVTLALAGEEPYLMNMGISQEDELTCSGEIYGAGPCSNRGQHPDAAEGFLCPTIQVLLLRMESKKALPQSLMLENLEEGPFKNREIVPARNVNC